MYCQGKGLKVDVRVSHMVCDMPYWETDIFSLYWPFNLSKKTLDIYDENILHAYGMGFELDIESSNFCEILDLHGHVIPEFHRNQRVYRRASVYYSIDWI